MTRFLFGISGAPSGSSKNCSAAVLTPRERIDVRDKEAAPAGLTGIFLILLQAENQPYLPAPRASLKTSLQGLFQLLSLFFTLHSLFPANALWGALRNKVPLFAFTIKVQVTCHIRWTPRPSNRDLAGVSRHRNEIRSRCSYALCGNLGLVLAKRYNSTKLYGYSPGSRIWQKNCIDRDDS
jgi:hypothetical protein